MTNSGQGWQTKIRPREDEGARKNKESRTLQGVTAVVVNDCFALVLLGITMLFLLLIYSSMYYSATHCLYESHLINHIGGGLFEFLFNQRGTFRIFSS